MIIRSTDWSRSLKFNILVYGGLVRRAFALHELSSLIEAILSSQDEGDTIVHLLGDDAQAFVDVMDEARSTSAYHLESVLIKSDINVCSVDQALDIPDLPPLARKKCLELLSRTCSRHTLLPTSLKIPVSLQQTVDTLHRGGLVEVWKGKNRNRDVAVKVIRIYSDSDLKKVSHWSHSVLVCLCTDCDLCSGSARRLSSVKPSSTQTFCH